MALVADLSPSPASASQQIATIVDGVAKTPTAILGWSLAESTGAGSAKVRLRDGTSVSAPVVAPITLVGGESRTDWFADQALELFNGGIYLEVVNGSVEGAVYWG